MNTYVYGEYECYLKCILLQSEVNYSLEWVVHCIALNMSYKLMRPSTTATHIIKPQPLGKRLLWSPGVRFMKRHHHHWNCIRNETFTTCHFNRQRWGILSCNNYLARSLCGVACISVPRRKCRGPRGAPKKRAGRWRSDETAVEGVNIANSVGLSQ